MSWLRVTRTETNEVIYDSNQYRRIHMRSSDATDQIATALAMFQATSTNVAKDATNPHYRSKYASLDATIEAVREPLAKVGLSVTQTSDIEGPVTILTTTLYHSSGQFIQGRMPLILGKQDMQGFGSAWSYARRYSLQAILGIAAADDDGNSASVPDFKPLAQSPAESFQRINEAQVIDKPGDYLITFGKFNRNKISQVDLIELQDYIAWLEKNAKATGKPMSKGSLELKMNFEAYCAATADNMDLGGPPF